MEQFVGLDVSQELTHLCVISSDGKTVWQGKCSSTPDDIAATIRSKAHDVIRFGLESGPLSTWHWHALKVMGLPVLCLDARHAKAAMSAQINKSDKNDAFGLAQIVKSGWYHVSNQIVRILKTFCVVVQHGKGMPFEHLVEEACATGATPKATVLILLSVYRDLKRQIAAFDRELRCYVRASECVGGL